MVQRQADQADERIYLDHNASTPLAPEVREAMLPFLEAGYGNPSSQHWAGRPAREAVERARGQVAEFLGADPQEIIFTSGGSEANNQALKGCWFARPPGRHRIVTSAVEHPAILEPCRFLTKQGAYIDLLPVDSTGRVEPASLKPLLGDDLLLLSVMHANNEVGTIQPVRELAEMAHRCGGLVHTDAAQSVGKIPVQVDDLGVDLLSVAGHKLYAPKGIGALYVRQGTDLEPLLHGAGHEAGRRAGTESALLAVGLGAACMAAGRDLERYTAIRELRDRLWQRLVADLGESIVEQGHSRQRLPNTLNVALRGVPGGEWLAGCQTVAASLGAACHGGGTQLSETLTAMGVDPEVGMGTVRFSLGKDTTAVEVDGAADLLVAAARRLLDR